MNTLGRQMLRILEETPLKTMSVHMLNKQCEESGINIDDLKPQDLPILISRLEKILPFFIGNNTRKVIRQLQRLDTGG
jgi:hypothetical protein